jgi:hypothetical protein
MIDCTKEDVKAFKKEIDRLKIVSQVGLDYFDSELIYKDLLRIFTLSSFLVCEGKFNEIKRITINKSILFENKRITDISHLKYPPAKFVKNYGRANLKSQSVLYGTFDIMTVLNEMKPDIGDLICISTWKLKKEKTLIYVPIFKRWELENGSVNLNMRLFESDYKKLSKNYPENVFQLIDLTNEFVADEFEKKVDRAYSDNYLFSAFFTNEILYNFWRDEGEPIDAILYPSVASKRSFNNIAIKPEVFDNLYELHNVKESIVVSRPTVKYKGYVLDGLSESNSIDFKRGEIIWKSSFYQPKEKMDFFIKKYNLKF